VEVLRLDAVGFIWKRLGTSCQNQPEVHDLLLALRACARIVAPAVIFKAEAIVSPIDLAAYLGVGRHHGRISDLAYHNSLMVQYWSAVATRDARLATLVLGRLPATPASTAWATYLRCHDDIGWAVLDEDAAAIGWSGVAHRRFLADFYAGKFPGSFARGEVFQDNPVTGDRRTSGSMASLAGLEDALASGDEDLADLAVRRILLGHALIFGYDGIPLLYMGDELGMRNDHGYLDDPARAVDNRWLHRPAMDRAAAGRRAEPGTVSQRLFSGLAALAAARRRTPRGGGGSAAARSCSPSSAATRSAPWWPSTTSPSSPSGSAPWPCTWSATTSRWTGSAAGRPGSSTARSCSTPTRPSGSPPRAPNPG
jgi:amylosucrase